MIAPLVALMLSAAPASGAPYPAPSATRETEGLRYASGRVVDVDPHGRTMQIVTPAGLLTLQTEGAAAFTSPDAKSPAQGGVSAFAPGQQVRVYYEIGDGAVAQEIDRAETPAP